MSANGFFNDDATNRRTAKFQILNLNTDGRRSKQATATIENGVQNPASQWQPETRTAVDSQPARSERCNVK